MIVGTCRQQACRITRMRFKRIGTEYWFVVVYAFYRLPGCELRAPHWASMEDREHVIKSDGRRVGGCVPGRQKLVHFPVKQEQDYYRNYYYHKRPSQPVSLLASPTRSTSRAAAAPVVDWCTYECPIRHQAGRTQLSGLRGGDCGCGSTPSRPPLLLLPPPPPLKHTHTHTDTRRLRCGIQGTLQFV